MTSELSQPSSPIQAQQLRKKKKKREPWPPVIFILFGMMIIFSTTMVKMAIGGDFVMFIFLIGFAFFLYGIVMHIVRIFYGVWQQRQK